MDWEIADLEDKFSVDLTDNAIRNGGRKTRKPEAAAKLIPMNAAIARVKPSMVPRCSLPVLMQTRNNHSAQTNLIA